MKCELNGKTLTFTFDGDLSPVVFNADGSPHAERAMMHGFEQRLRDAAAIARKQKDGSVITVTEAMRRERVAALAEHLSTSDKWEMTAARVPAKNPVIQQLADARGITYEQAQAWIAEQAIAELSK